MLYDVVALEGGPTHALAAASLGAVVRGQGALGVAAAGDRDDEVLVGDQVLHGEVTVGRDDLGASGYAELLHDRLQLVADDLPLARLVGEDVLEVGDDRLELGEPVHDLLALESRQAAQLHVEDRLGLDLVDLEQLHQAGAGLVDVRAAPDQRDHLVERVQRLGQAAVDVRVPLGLREAVAGTTLDDLDLVGHPVRDELVERQRARHAVDQRQHVRGEVGLQLGVLEQVVQHDPGHGLALEYDDQPLAGPRGRVVAYVGDALHSSGVGELGDLQREVVRVDLVGQLGDGQAGAALVVLVDLHHGAHLHRAATGAVGLLDPGPTHDQRAGREVRALDPLEQGVEQLLPRGVGVGQRPEHAVGDLVEVVRRDVGGHADRDAGRAVDQQVREPSRQHQRLLGAAVVVGAHVDGVLVDVADHLHGQRSEPALGVPHGRRGVVARRAEVALAVDQRRAHHPGLREAHQGVVDRGVAVRVVLPHHVADDAGALGEPAVGTVAAVVHRVEDPAVHRLQPVAYVGQRAADDHRHRVVDVGLLHLVLQLDLADARVVWG